MSKKAVLYSSPSTTVQPPWPSRHGVLPRGTPPISAVGSRPAAVRMWVTSAVVVVLPCVPATTTERAPAQNSSPNAAACEVYGIPRSSTACTSMFERGRALPMITRSTSAGISAGS